MSDADRAYAAAQKMIAKAGKATSLDFDTAQTRALTRLPPEISGLNKLQELWLINTAFGDDGMMALQGMPELQRLYLDNTGVTDAGMGKLHTMARLQWLSLDSTGITDTGLAALQGMAVLQRLSLGNTGVTDAGLKTLQGMAGLQGLYLNNTGVTDVGLRALAGIPGLQMLSLDNTGVTDAGLKVLQGMGQMLELWLNNTRITDAGLWALSGMERLRTLTLNNTPVRDLRALKDMTSLEDTAHVWIGLHFAGTAATWLDPELKWLSEIRENTYRTRETLTYLQGLGKDYGRYLRERDTLLGGASPVVLPPASAELKGRVSRLLQQPAASALVIGPIGDEIGRALREWQNETGANQLPAPLERLEVIGGILSGIAFAVTTAAHDRQQALEGRVFRLEEEVRALTAALAEARGLVGALEAKLAAPVTKDEPGEGGFSLTFRKSAGEEAGKRTVQLAAASAFAGVLYVLGENSTAVQLLLKALEKLG